MSSLENALAEALIRICVLTPVDSYGNRMESPLLRALDEWSVKNQSKLFEAVAKSITTEKVADLVVERIQAVLKNHSNWGSFGRDKFMSLLEPMIMDKMAATLAVERLAELKKPTV